MGLIVHLWFAIPLVLIAVIVGCGLLAVCKTLAPLRRRQRAVLYVGPERRRQCEIAQRWAEAGRRP